MSNIIYFSIACDTDPDINPPFRIFDAKKDKNERIWKGVAEGIEILRQRLKNDSFLFTDYKKLPVTWLLRSDRQIYELYGNPAFCFQQFEDIWKKERSYGSETGWHPHLYRWHEKAKQWMPNLGLDDDIPMLTECINCLRQYTDIYAVRTGWDYHSNRLMSFFDEQKLLVDASALPGCTQNGDWFHDWRKTPRAPYFPSRFDYRHSEDSLENVLKIIEMPALVRRLTLPLQAARYAARKLRAIKQNANSYLVDWESAKWQGVRLATSECKPFIEAVRQTIAAYSENQDIFLVTYFHTQELILPIFLERFMLNLKNLFSLSDRMGLKIVPITLSAASSLAKRQNRLRQDQKKPLC